MTISCLKIQTTRGGPGSFLTSNVVNVSVSGVFVESHCIDVVVIIAV